MSDVGSVSALWRYPVKSMRGEACTEVDVGGRGVAGDRAYALVDAQSGKIASAKNPRLWPDLLSYGARYLEPPDAAGRAARVEVAFPSGTKMQSDDAALARMLSVELGRPVRFSASAPVDPVLDEYWPDMEDLAHRDTVTEEATKSQTFFDAASVHLVTQRTLEALHALAPEASFSVARFRPNIVVEAPDDDADFPEDAWVGRSLHIGDVVLNITQQTGRCVMTTLAQQGLPNDGNVLRTAARNHSAYVGVYAEVVRGGTVRVGERLILA